MRFQKASVLRRIFTVLLSLVLLFGTVSVPAFAENDPLTPEDLTYEDGNIILHKQAERIAADEWKIHVQATIKDQPVEPPKLEVAFVLDVSKSMKMCAHENVHTLGYHFSHNDCPLICGNSAHEHVNACYLCNKEIHIHVDNGTCSHYSNDAGKYVDYTSRYEIAKQVISKMVGYLPEGTRVGRVVFASASYCTYWDGVSTITPQGETYLMNGVRLALSKDGDTPCFTDDPTTKKIMIIVTDGAATDNDYGATDTAFQDFRNNGGIVYTVGFNHTDPNLSSMIANGGTYSQASNPDQLEQIFDHISMELTAMLVDPMGSSVGFETNSAQQPSSSVAGSISFDSGSNTLYWHPQQSADIANSTIEYTYTVNLNSNADKSVGVHSDVPLNDPTSLLYGINQAGTTDMKSAAFPIPRAEYAISSVQVNWKAGSTDLKTPTATESVICDWPGAAFTTDYSTILPTITYGGKDYYYNGTVITKNGQEVDSVSITDAAAFVVTHQYSEIATYQVTYEYTGEVPENAPDAAANNKLGLRAGDTVQVADAPAQEGYVFSGWTVAEGNATIENGSFSMPESNVKLQGHWAKLNGYRVLVNYFTSTNGGAYVQDNASPIKFMENLQTTGTNVSVDLTPALLWNGHVYSSPALVAGSAPAQINGNFIDGISPADPAAEVIVNLYRDVRTTATVTVHYVDSEGNKLKEDTATDAIYVGDDFDVSEAEDVTSITANGKIYDFVSDDDAAYTGKMPENGLEITRVYKERSKAFVAVHYVDSEGNQLRDDTDTDAIYVGDDYDVSEAEDVTSITVGNVIYDFVSDDDAAYTGKMPAQGVEITRVYKERNKATVTVHYVDSEGNKLQDDTVSNALYVGDDFDVSEAEDVTSITVGNVIYDFVSDDDAAYTGKMPAQGVVITRVYKERSKATVTVHYVDSDGNKLTDDTVSDAIYVGDDYDVSEAEDVTSITVNGKIYDFVSDDDAAYTGKMPENGLEITRVYQKKDVPGNSKPESTTPNTGDPYVYILTAVMLISACALFVLTAKKWWQQVMR